MQQLQRNKYLENSVQTATPAQLLIMLYDGAIRFCKQAIAAIKQNNYEEAHINLTKTQDIISEFVITLDRNSSIAESLLRLYEYFNFRLIEANIQKKAESAEEVLGYLIELKETWMQAVKAGQSGNAKLG
ncbi:flagellar export chaperone FliS [Paenibacillus allorhizosphaerae]|uniref:Flagellar secretion chaperone FliS n=1 Tax=Paenibacillus allorhizosphaerae TaxID=2849866 RepID=A0ABN7TUA6_9BACL|nr:flagellar export chaperone FliS [Paenibacillus allorhizosphaerae]CAG7656157.1 Flagellar secretion chaperone FliS [Paenibacillus allorhizosphaerae]